jgi:Bacteriophage clamp loader A subunit
MPDLFREVLPSIMVNKKEVFVDDREKDKWFLDNSFILIKAISMYLDTAISANIMNVNNHLDGKLKYDYFINTIRGYKRPHSYVKSIKYNADDLEIIKEYYGIGNAQAREYHSLLSPEQIETLRKKLYKGGLSAPVTDTVE